ncbi:nuclear protein 96-domain-containing protein [Xylariomycetidae sp. FL0641]|nr:nuclear protein 96-domain-containing protein [Xylariomycetidae sp. FL0641]
MSFGGFGGGSGFGSTANNNTGTGFGGFGSTNNTTSAFGAGNTGGGGAFGAASNNAGGSLFGSGSGGGGTTSTGFGTNTGAFGANNTTSAFGAPKPGGFGNTASTGGGGLFGNSSSTPASGGGFGSFGTQNNNTNASTSSPFGGGGGGGLFGANKGGFGSSAAPASGGGLFGSNTTNTANPGTSAFGSFGAANNPTSTALGAVGDPPGTANITQFQPLVEKDSATSSAQNSFQNILFHDPYKKWSAEELRLVDYAAGRRFGGTAGNFGVGSGFGSFGAGNQSSTAFGGSNTNNNAGGGLFGTSAPASGGFGQAQSSNTGAFGSGASGGLFGNKPAATGGLFGNNTTSQPAQSGGGGLFGNTGGGGFGSTANTGTGAFGQSNTNSGGLFGNNTQNQNQSKPGFSFGNTNTGNTTGGGFGGASAFGGGATNTGGGLFGSSSGTNNTNTGGGLFGSTNQQQQQPTTGAFGGGGGAFGASNQQQTGGGLFGNNANNQQKPAGGGLFGSSTNTGAAGGGGLFGSSTTGASPFGQSGTNQSGGGLFGNKPATGGAGLFGGSGTAQNSNTGGGLFGGLGQNNQNQQQNTQQPGGLFGSGGLGQNQTQQKPSLFGQSNPTSTGGGLFGGQSTQQQGGIFGASTQQQPQNTMGSSFFGGSQPNQSTQSLTASINDPSAYGSLFANMGSNESASPGPLATPTSKKQSKRPSILPYYKLNPASASRFVTPQKRGGFGFSYSTYGTPNSPSSTTSTPGSLSQSLLGGSLSRSLGKSVSSNSLRRNFNVEDSLLAPGAFSSSTGPRFYGGNSVKKLVINKDLRSDLFSTPTREETPNGARKLQKRVSFDTDHVTTIENGEAAGGSSNSTPSSEKAGHGRSNGLSGLNGSKPSPSSNTPEMEQVKGNELAVVHEEEVSSPVRTPAGGPADGEPGQYWMSPTKDEILNMNRIQRQKVTDFTVGRENIGFVKFRVPVDLTTVEIDSILDGIVKLEPRSATVYPIAAKKPPMGKGLNVPALITLENAWPRASRGKPTTLSKHIERLKKIPDTKFEKYDAETGQWVFSVEHFTTYGLDDSDDEGEEPVDGIVSRVAAGNESASSAESSQASLDGADDYELPAGRRSVPGAFDRPERSESEEPEMAEANGSRQSFLADRSAGSVSKALAPFEQDVEMDEEYAMSETSEAASASLGQHLAAEQDNDSFDAGQMPADAETPAGIMRARMRAVRGSATPVKVQIAAGDDWMDMLGKTISPQKRDRALLRSIHEAGVQRELDSAPLKKRVVSDGRGFATSIDLMNSLFEKAKAPAENLQASVRPQGVKWPYKRVTKTLDENEMNPEDQTWHRTLRPTWGPNGTLVFATTPSASTFGRSSRLMEKHGLMTVMRDGIVSKSQDIRIAKFTNEMSAKAVDAQSKLTRVHLVDKVPAVELNPKISLRDFSVSGGAKNSADEHEKLVWDLASVLFDNVKIPVELQNDPDAEEKLRREHLSRLWESMVEDRTNKAIAMAGSSEEKALASLSGHRVADACKHLLDGKNYRLATLTSLIGTSEGVKKDMREQVREWQDANVLSEFSQPIRALYEMMSGNVCACDGNKGALENRMESFVISKRFGLNWQQAFGLRLWYAVSSEDSIAEAVLQFQEDVEQGKELSPTTWFLEHGIQGMWNDPAADKREDLLWGLLRLYSDTTADLEAILQPENSQLSPLDFRLCWQLGQALTSTGRLTFGKNATEKADAATVSYAAQLTHEGSWTEAIFVLLHLTDPDARSRAIQEHLCRHAGLIGNEKSTSFKKLATDLKIPTQWIWHAKALYMRSVKKDPTSEVQCLLRAGSWADAHKTFMKEVAPVTIIQREYDLLADVLEQFEGRHALVPDWNVGGEIYKAFLQLMGCQRRGEQPPQALVTALLEGLPAMQGNTPEASTTEYVALTEMAAELANVVATMAKIGQMEHDRILHLPLTEDVMLKHSRDLAWSHYREVAAGH